MRKVAGKFVEVLSRKRQWEKQRMLSEENQDLMGGSVPAVSALISVKIGIQVSWRCGLCVLSLWEEV